MLNLHLKRGEFQRALLNFATFCFAFEIVDGKLAFFG